MSWELFFLQGVVGGGLVWKMTDVDAALGGGHVPRRSARLSLQSAAEMSRDDDYSDDACHQGTFDDGTTYRRMEKDKSGSRGTPRSRKGGGAGIQSPKSPKTSMLMQSDYDLLSQLKGACDHGSNKVCPQRSQREQMGGWFTSSGWNFIHCCCLRSRQVQQCSHSWRRQIFGTTARL